MRLTEEEARALGIVSDPPKKKSKYGARKVTVDGIKFDSQLEADYYVQLKLLQRAGQIDGFCRQGRFVVTEGANGERATEYVCDFVVFYPNGTFQIVDTKGVETEVFKLKRKAFAEKYPKLKINLLHRRDI